MERWGGCWVMQRQGCPLIYFDAPLGWGCAAQVVAILLQAHEGAGPSRGTGAGGALERADGLAGVSAGCMTSGDA